MHVCKDRRHKKQHYAFLIAKGKKENPTQDCCCCCRTGSPTDHKGMSIKEEICKLRSWKAQRHHTWHRTPNTSCSHSMDSSTLYPGWRKQHQQLILFTLDKAAFPHPPPQRLARSFPNQWRSRQQKTSGQPQIHSLAVEQSKLNAFLQGTATDMGGLATPQGSQQHPHFPFHNVCVLKHLPAHLSSRDLFYSQCWPGTG